MISRYCSLSPDLVGGFLQLFFVGTQTRAQTTKGIGRSWHHWVANLLCRFQGIRYLKDAHKYYTARIVNTCYNTLKYTINLRWLCRMYHLSLIVYRKKMIFFFFSCYCFLTDSTAILGAIFSLISISLSAKSCLSSVAMMDSTEVPRTFTPYFSRTPRWNNSTPDRRTNTNPIRCMVNHAGNLNNSCSIQYMFCEVTVLVPHTEPLSLSYNQYFPLLKLHRWKHKISHPVHFTQTIADVSPQLSAVCPPMDSRMPSGRSTLMTSVTNSGVTGRK